MVTLSRVLERKPEPSRSLSRASLIVLIWTLTAPLRGAAPEIADPYSLDNLDDVVVRGIKPPRVEDFVAREQVDGVVLSPGGTRFIVGHMGRAKKKSTNTPDGKRVTLPTLDGFATHLSLFELPSLEFVNSSEWNAYLKFADNRWFSENRFQARFDYPRQGFEVAWQYIGGLRVVDLERKSTIVMNMAIRERVRGSVPVELQGILGEVRFIADGPLRVVDARTGVVDEALIQTTLSEKKGNRLKYGAFEVNTSNGALKRVASLPVDGGDFLTGEGHRVTLATATNDRHERVVYYLPSDLREKERKDPDVRHWQLRVTSDAVHGLEPIAWTGKANEYYALDGRGLPTRAVVIWDAEHDTSQILHGDPEVDIQTFSLDPAGKPWMFSGNDAYPVYWYPDPEHPLARLHQTLVQRLPRERIEILNATDDYALAVAKISSARRPPVFALLDVKSARARRTFQTYPQLNGSRMAPVDVIEYPAEDGITIHGYLTTPLDADGNHRRKIPMVVIAHEGPEGKAADYSFDFERQLFAAYGYAVLQVNHRGLTGRGAPFSDPAMWQSKAQDDIAAGVRWAIQQGVADAKRVCFYGSGYGAESAMTAVARTPELFHCAIGVNGAYDSSIVGSAASIKARVLLLHQRRDPQFPIDAASRLRAALKAAGHAPEWEVIGPDDIGFITPSTRAKAYREVIRFLDQQLRQ